MMHTHQMSGMQTKVLDKQPENQDYSPLTANRRSSADSWNQAELMSLRAVASGEKPQCV